MLIIKSNRNKVTSSPTYAPVPHAPHPSTSAFLNNDLVLQALTLVQLPQPSKEIDQNTTI